MHGTAWFCRPAQQCSLARTMSADGGVKLLSKVREREVEAPLVELKVGLHVDGVPGEVHQAGDNGDRLIRCRRVRQAARPEQGSAGLNLPHVTTGAHTPIARA